MALARIFRRRFVRHVKKSAHIQSVKLNKMCWLQIFSITVPLQYSHCIMCECIIFDWRRKMLSMHSKRCICVCVCSINVLFPACDVGVLCSQIFAILQCEKLTILLSRRSHFSRLLLFAFGTSTQTYTKNFSMCALFNCQFENNQRVRFMRFKIKIASRWWHAPSAATSLFAF